MTGYRPLMVLGCSSNSGKSLLATALCRWFARQGIDVAPFKAQNMSNNARVVDGGEIGVAQWLQARAANLEPTVDMNPVLLKPEADTRSQVIVQGVARPDFTAMPWRDRGPSLWPPMVESYGRIAAAHELVVLEGAGSPAEINLDDLVNNRMLDHTDATAILVADIDRGGAFAHLVGTWTLVPESTRRRMSGFVLNKFRGDASLLEPAPTMVSERTGMQHVGVLPMLSHELPDEEGGSVRAIAPDDAPRVAIVRYPYASNLDEWHLLARAANVRWAMVPADLDGADVVVLPGSKHVAADMAWLRAQRLDLAVRHTAACGARVIGVCGGAMIAGSRITDPHGVEGGDFDGLGLLALSTDMAPTKITTATRVEFSPTGGPWSRLAGVVADGYEIRYGVVSGSAHPIGQGVWTHGAVMATTVHGLFEHPDVIEAVFGNRPAPVLDTTFDQLADAVEQHLDTDYLWRAIEW
jgi:adenosylcobyric acid synthase